MTINQGLRFAILIIVATIIFMSILFIPIYYLVEYIDKKTGKIVPSRILLVIPWLIFLLGLGVLLTTKL